MLILYIENIIKLISTTFTLETYKKELIIKTTTGETYNIISKNDISLEIIDKVITVRCIVDKTGIIPVLVLI